MRIDPNAPRRGGSPLASLAGGAVWLLLGWLLVPTAAAQVPNGRVQYAPPWVPPQTLPAPRIFLPQLPAPAAPAPVRPGPDPIPSAVPPPPLVAVPVSAGTPQRFREARPPLTTPLDGILDNIDVEPRQPGVLGATLIPALDSVFQVVTVVAAGALVLEYGPILVPAGTTLCFANFAVCTEVFDLVVGLAAPDGSGDTLGNGRGAGAALLLALAAQGLEWLAHGWQEEARRFDRTHRPPAAAPRTPQLVQPPDAAPDRRHP